MRKLHFVFFSIILISVIALGQQSDNVAGRYINQQSPKVFLELNSNGTFSLGSGKDQITGTFTASGTTLILSYTVGGSDKIAVQDGGLVWGREHWVKQVVAASGDQSLTNKDIIGMVSLGLSDELVIEKIRTTRNAAFDTSLEGLKGLKAANVSDPVIKQMMGQAVTTSSVPPAAKVEEPKVLEGMPATDGVYYKTSDGKWVALEILHSSGHESSGHFITVKAKRVYRGAEAPVRMSERTPLFFARFGNAESTRDWDIVQLEKKQDHRELEIGSAGVFKHPKSGITDQELQSVVVAHVTDDVFSIKPATDLSNGEYVVAYKELIFYDFGISQ